MKWHVVIIQKGFQRKECDGNAEIKKTLIRRLTIDVYTPQVDGQGVDFIAWDMNSGVFCEVHVKSMFKRIFLFVGNGISE